MQEVNKEKMVTKETLIPIEKTLYGKISGRERLFIKMEMQNAE